jgi:hypothetical protein
LTARVCSAHCAKSGFGIPILAFARCTASQDDLVEIFGQTQVHRHWPSAGSSQTIPNTNSAIDGRLCVAGVRGLTRNCDYFMQDRRDVVD